MSKAGQTRKRAGGYAMAAMLVAIAVMTVAMTVALPAWRQAVRREKEEELVFRGRQYVRAIQLFQRKFAGAYPPDVDVLLSAKFLRRKYKDPMVEDGDFEILYQGSVVSTGLGQSPTLRQGAGGGRPGGSTTVGLPSTPGPGGSTTTLGQPAGGLVGGIAGGPRGGVIGVHSKSTEESIRVYNGATHYNEWLFVFMPASLGRGQTRPGIGGPGQSMPGAPGGGGRGGPFRGGAAGPGGSAGPYRGGPGFNR
jgi:type II secretory pathway pseudopilin PulG